MNPNSTHVGLIIIAISILIIILLVLIYKVQQHKAEQIKNYNKIVKTCIQSIDIFSKESAKLRKITECLVQEMQDFKNSEAYKSYKNGK